MVDLPSLANNVVQIRPPTPGVSPGQIAAPFQELAANLDKAGEVTKDLSVQFAEQAGHRAVMRDTDGNLVIRPAPIIGEASAAYMRAARHDYLARRQPEMENKATEIQLQYRDDPAGFKTAWGEYTKGILAGEKDPLLKAPIENMLGTLGGHGWRATAVQANTDTTANTLQSLKSRLTTLNEQGGSLARQGGVDTAEYARIHNDRAAIYNELTQNPIYHYPKERADLELKENRDADVVQAVIGNVVRKYKTRANSVEAQRELQDAFWGEGSERLSLSPQKRDAGVAEGLKSLERIGVESKVEVQQFQSAVQTYVGNIQKAPNTFDEINHNTLRQRATELGDYKTAAELDAARAFVPVWQAFKQMTPAEQNVAYGQIARNIVPAIPVRLRDTATQAMIEREAERQGVPPQLAVTIAAIESGGNARSVTGSYKGIFQLSDQEFAKYGSGDIFSAEANTRAGIASLKEKAAAFEQRTGHAPTPTEIYLMHQQGEGGLAAHLANPNAPAFQNMLSTAEGRQKGEAWAKAAIWGNVPDSVKAQFGSVENITSGQFMALWQQKVQGIPYGETGLQAGQPVASIRNPYALKLWESTVKQVREVTGRNADRLADQIITQAKARDPIPDETLQTFVTAALTSGKDELIDKVQPSLAALDAERTVIGTSAVGALRAAIEARKAAGVPPVEHQMLTQLDHSLQANAKEWTETPLIAGAHAQTIAPVKPLDLRNPQNAAPELANRQQKIALLQNPAGHALGPTSAIADKNEGEAIKVALTQGDPKAASALLAAMQSSLAPDTFKATMSSDEMKAALSGMIRSRDPTRMTAGFSALDKLWRLDSWGFEQNFRSDMEHLQVWQALRESYAPAEIAERLNQANDPSKMKALADTRKAAEDEAKTWKPTDVAYQMGSAWGLPATWEIQRHITGSTPDIPPTVVGVGNIADEMLHDFQSIYTGLRTYGVPAGSFTDGITGAKNAKTLAVQRLQNKWGISQVAGNQVMAYPPDLVSTDKDTGEKRGAYYPLVDGSHAWMQKDLASFITSIKGPETTIGPSDVVGGGVRTNWTFKGLVADAQTQAEISAGKPPSYRVVVDSGNGLNEILVDPATGRDRIAWNPLPHITGMQERFGAMNKLAQPLSPSQILDQGQFQRNVRAAVRGE